MSKQIYRVWAWQRLSDDAYIEAESPEEAERIAEFMYRESGQLDPREITDGDCGAEAVPEWEPVEDHRITAPDETAITVAEWAEREDAA